MTYTIENINQIIDGSLLQLHHADPVHWLVTDSRKLIYPDSSIFFALQGLRRSGDQFVRELYERGVKNFVLANKMPLKDFPNANFILVKDALKALQHLAAWHRLQFNYPVIGITGSNGKTIVKEWLNQMLEDRFDIVRSPKSYNSQIGVPLSVWQMSDADDLAIFEAGISQSGEMKNLEEIIRPTIGILTNIGEAHSQGFKTEEKKIKEKFQLFRHAGALIYCKDHKPIEKWILTRSRKNDMKLISWGKSGGSSIGIRRLRKVQGNSAVTLSHEGREFSVNIPFTDDASFENVMSCISLMIYLGIDHESIQQRLSRLQSVAMRLELQHGINHCSIINDSYSADMNSLKIALDFLTQQPHHAKRTVILSDILQSGEEDKKLYKQVAQLLKHAKINRLIGIGEKMQSNHEFFMESLHADIQTFPSTEAFIHDFQKLNFRDEIILIKGARIFQFERIDHLLALQAHQTVLEINLNSIAHNLKQYQQLLNPTTRIMAMVKAFSYGTGSFEIASFLQFHKIDWLAVAYTDEAVELRKSGINTPIMVMNAEENSLEELIQYNLEPVIFSFRLLESVDRYLKKEGIQQFAVHLEIETGMHRLGFEQKDIPELIQFLKASSCKVQSVFTHLAASEESQHDAFTMEQVNQFKEAVANLRKALPHPFLIHIANSAAIIRFPELQFDMVRLGIGLYGIDSASSNRLPLQEVAELKTTIAQIKKLRQGETVGYNRKGIATADMTIATVRIGYADGYPRSLANGAGKMLVRGRMSPTIGNICMDMTMIDITGIEDIREGEEVVVFGKNLSVQQVAHWARTNPYEILSGVAQRVKRIYYED